MSDIKGLGSRAAEFEPAALATILVAGEQLEPPTPSLPGLTRQSMRLIHKIMTLLGKRLIGVAKQVRAIVRGDDEKPFHPAYGAQKGTMRIMPGVDITQPADPDLADYLDAQYGKEKREN